MNMASRSVRPTDRLLAALGLAFCLHGAQAAQPATQPFTARLHGSVERSGNAEQQQDGDDATIARLGLAADLAHDGRRVDYGLAGNAAWARYSGGLENGLEGGLNGYLMLGAADSMLRWTAQDSLRQSRISAFGNATPDNSEFVNSFSTGPQLRFRLGTRGQLSFSGLYTHQTYQDSGFDSNGVRGTASLSRALPGGILALNASAMGMSYLEGGDALPGYDLQELSLSYQAAAGGRTSLGLEAGYSRTRSAGIDRGSPLVRLTLQRRVSGISTVFLNATREHTDAASVGSFANPLPMMPAGDTPLSAAGAVESSSVEAGWTAGGRRTTMTLSGGWRREDYQSAAQFDREVMHAGLGFQRRLRSTLTASLHGEYRIEDLEIAGLPRSHHRDVDFSLTRRIGRRLDAGLTTGYSQRRDASMSAQEFSGWRYGLNFGLLLTDPRG